MSDPRQSRDAGKSGEPTDDAWDGLIEAAGIEPDLAEVLARARAKDPGAVPFGVDAGLDSRGDVADREVVAPPDRATSDADAVDLVPFTSAYRLAMDELVDLRLLEPLRPPTRRPHLGALGRPQRARRVRRVAAVAAFMATGVAAAAALVLAGPPGIAASRPVESAGVLAEHLRGVDVEVAASPAISEAPPAPAPASSPDGASPVEAVVDSADTDTDGVELEDELQDTDTDTDTDTGPRSRRKGRQLEGEALTDALAELDRRARAAWKAGKLAEAERLFRKIIKTGGRHRLVELAYGDLFALTAQRGRSLASVWRAYLRRFPRGRYADDARAGLCRLAPQSKRGACWDDYRRDFPNGTHAP